MENFGKKIKTIRIKKKFTLEQLSRKSGLDRSYIYKIESGKIKNPYPATLLKIARGLSINVNQLYSFGEPDNSVAFREEAKVILQNKALPPETTQIVEHLQRLYESDEKTFKRVVKIVQEILLCFKQKS